MSEQSNNTTNNGAGLPSEAPVRVIAGIIRVRRHTEANEELKIKVGDKVNSSPVIEISNAGVSRRYDTSQEPFQVTEAEMNVALASGLFEVVESKSPEQLEEEERERARQELERNANVATEQQEEDDALAQAESEHHDQV